MKKNVCNTKFAKLNVLRSGDPNTAFHRFSPEEILTRFGPPQYLLSSSVKAEKCSRVGVLARVLYLTPGVFCSAATAGCLRACLGHTSGRMQMPTHAAARDRRAALYLQAPDIFLHRLRGEIAMLSAEASLFELRPAVRLNGSSDLPWERFHPSLFREFPEIDFFDYTKVFARMQRYLQLSHAEGSWPSNYHLTFSAAANNHAQARKVLEQGGNVAVVFWPHIPDSWWGFPVIDGESHDARFLDSAGVIVGLKAKGLARVDLQGFTLRPCPRCAPEARELQLQLAHRDTHLATLHECARCGFQLRERHKLPITSGQVHPRIGGTFLSHQHLPLAAAS